VQVAISPLVLVRTQAELVVLKKKLKDAEDDLAELMSPIKAEKDLKQREILMNKCKVLLDEAKAEVTRCDRAVHDVNEQIKQQNELVLLKRRGAVLMHAAASANAPPASAGKSSFVRRGLSFD
jgi:hypothetical protein